MLPVEVCFHTETTRTLLRDATFEVGFHSSTATPGVDFMAMSLLGNITIPQGHRGDFKECRTIHIFGDDEEEMNEDIQFSFRALSSMDDVYIPEAVRYSPNVFRVVIYDNDG